MAQSFPFSVLVVAILLVPMSAIAQSGGSGGGSGGGSAGGASAVAHPPVGRAQAPRAARLALVLPVRARRL